MDPNGSFPKDARSSKIDEAYISPLHEALRGTTAFPRLDEYVAHDSSTIPPIISAPQETAVLPGHNYPSYYPNIALPTSPPFPQQNFHPASHVNTTISEARLVSGAENQQQVFPQQNFLTTPVGDYFNSSHQLQIMSTESPPVTSLLQGDPFAVVHAHFNTTGVLDNGPIFENSAARLVAEVNSMPSGHPFQLQSHQPFISSTVSQQQRSLLGSSSHVESFSAVPSDERTFGVSHMSPYVPMEQSAPFVPREQSSSGGVQVQAVSSAVVSERVQREYRCRLCPHATFGSPQAYGGHMSAHSKKDKRNMSAGPSSRRAN